VVGCEGEWLFWIIREDDKTMAVQLTEQGGWPRLGWPRPSPFGLRS